jgi:hypothetical protein
MKRIEFPDQIKQHFLFLYDEYGFSTSFEEYYPDVFGNWLVLLESRTCKIRFTLDRGQVLVGVGPTGFDDDWYDLSVTTAYLERFTGSGEWTYEIPKGPINTASIDRQLSRLAVILRKHLDSIIQLFDQVAYNKNKQDLVEFRKKRAEQWRKRLG